jgi:transposase
VALVQADDAMRQRFELLTCMPGIAEISALQSLDSWLRCRRRCRVRQWVAHSGLDPAHEVSDSSISTGRRGSATQGNHHLRTALYMPALVAYNATST